MVCASASQHVDTVCRCLFVVGEIAVLGVEDSKEGIKTSNQWYGPGTACTIVPWIVM